MVQQLEKSPLFIDFNVRNKRIIEDLNHKDFSEVEPKNRFQDLLSYMPEKQIYKRIKKRQYEAVQAILNAKSLPVFVDYENFSKGYSTNISKIVNDFKNTMLYGHKSPILNCGFNFLSVPFVGSVGGVTAFDDTDLKAYWKFNEASGDIINLSQAAADLGSGADMQTTNITYGATGIIGDAITFNGTSGFATVGTSLTQFGFIRNRTALFSLVMWLKFSSLTGDQKITQGADLLSEIGFNISKQATGRYTFQSLNGTDGTDPIVTLETGTSYIPDTTTWHLYIITGDFNLGSNQIKITRDDANLVQGVTTIATNNANTDTGENAQPIGTNPPASGNFYAGDTDEWSWWNRVLTGAEQTSLYNGGAGLEIY